MFDPVAYKADRTFGIVILFCLGIGLQILVGQFQNRGTRIVTRKSENPGWFWTQIRFEILIGIVVVILSLMSV